jgi:hypothetical protein
VLFEIAFGFDIIDLQSRVGDLVIIIAQRVSVFANFLFSSAYWHFFVNENKTSAEKEKNSHKVTGC